MTGPANLFDNFPDASSYPDDAGLLHTIDRTVTAGDARRGAGQFAESLARGNVDPHQAVAVQLPNCPEFVIAMFGVWLHGAVFVPVNPRATEREVQDIIETTGAVALVRDDGIAPVDADRVYEPDAAFITWTSGTTGRPKPIVQTHSGYTELLDRILGPLRAGPADSERRPTPNLIPVSLALNAGIYNVLFGLRAGAEIVIMDKFRTDEFAELVARFAIRSTVLPPPAMVALNDDPAVTDLTPLRYVRSITAPLSPLQARRFTEKFGVTVLNGYGQAEIGEVIGWTAGDAKEHPEKVGAVGKPHPGVDIKIVDDEGTAVEPGEVARLLVRPPRMAAGYADGSSLADRLDADGFVDTGDFARVDDDGFVWLEGRSSDMINRGGNKVFPDQVEEVLRLSPAVRDVAVVGVPDDRLGEVPVAFLVGDPQPAFELERLCREHLVPYKVPVSFHYVDEIPRSEIGKVLRRELARTWLPTGEPAPAE
jgi:long-chain acyl-CoA synthetase